MRPKHKRALAIGVTLVGIAIVTTVVLSVLKENLLFFYTPTDVATQKVPLDRTFRLGGMVVENSIQRNGMQLQFKITDYEHTVDVSYKGLVPNLFREGQGAIAEGSMNESGIFTAKRILAKHDENYMPPEVARSLKTEKGGYNADN